MTRSAARLIVSIASYVIFIATGLWRCARTDEGQGFH
jgi:hypothetical protein